MWKDNKLTILSTQKIISRLEAELNGERFFFTGKPCANNHIALRYTCTGDCLDCVTARRRKRAEKVAAKNQE